MKRAFSLIEVLTVTAIVVLISGLLVAAVGQQSCDQSAPKSDSGVKKASVKVAVGPSGRTVEQDNVRNRLLEDNKPGAIKHLYVVSPYSGDILFYSTVKGKITSSGKRLSPYSVVASPSTEWANKSGYDTPDGKETAEVLQDDGTYGSSVPYIYWWDVNGIYTQWFFTGGQIILVRSQPLPNVPKIIINVESAPAPG